MSNELAERIEPQAVVSQSAQQNPMQMLQAAVERGVDLPMLEKLMDLEERWRAVEAKKAYDQAVAAFHANPPKVLKDKINPQFGSQYSSLGNTVTTVNEELGQHSLHTHWDIKQPDGKVIVTCFLSHALGHRESVTVESPPDKSGAKNPIQEIKSAITYLRGVTFEAVTGIATQDKQINPDDDGNGAGAKTITDEQAAELKALLQETNSDTLAFLKAMGGAPSVDELPAGAYNRAKVALNRKKLKQQEASNAE